ncbi:hypothetical protein [Pseudomonas sp.]|uniref:hypothetical protein n=1 Tax=Pseudomonas sp. TaxID=306 RepID=UPI002588EDB3|nr:hypothetical protein [Pseudomonas sp.]
MTDQIASIAKQRGKTVAMFAFLGFVQSMAHPETAGVVWPAVGLAVASLSAMEAWASSKGSE